jgi:lysozyme family protein
MADPLKAWQFVLSNEDTVPPSGKVVDEPNGGKARLGINSIAHPEALARGFFSMPLAQALDFAEDIFKYDYWSRILGYNIHPCLQIVASKWADLVFNAGIHEGTIIVQRALNSLRGPNQKIKEDGICGPSTIAALNTLLDEPDVERIYQAIIAAGTAFYAELRTAFPEKYSEALEREWIGRLDRRPPV